MGLDVGESEQEDFSSVMRVRYSLRGKADCSAKVKKCIQESVFLAWLLGAASSDTLSFRGLASCGVSSSGVRGHSEGSTRALPPRDLGSRSPAPPTAPTRLLGLRLRGGDGPDLRRRPCDPRAVRRAPIETWAPSPLESPPPGVIYRNHRNVPPTSHRQEEKGLNYLSLSRH